MKRREHTTSRPCAQRGFTLIELVTVLVILGIITAVVAPKLFDNAIFSQRGYADEIAASLRYSQRIAVATECNVRFTVNAAGYSAAQPTVRCNTGGTWNVPLQFADRTALAGTPPSGIVVNAVVAEFTSAGNLVNPVAALNVGPFAVTIDPASGAVTVQ